MPKDGTQIQNKPNKPKHIIIRYVQIHPSLDRLSSTCNSNQRGHSIARCKVYYSHNSNRSLDRNLTLFHQLHSIRMMFHIHNRLFLGRTLIYVRLLCILNSFVRFEYVVVCYPPPGLMSKRKHVGDRDSRFRYWWQLCR